MTDHDRKAARREIADALLKALERRHEIADVVVESFRPDVIHAHSPVLNALPALHVGPQFGVPVVYELRALWEDAAVDPLRIANLIVGLRYE